MNLSRNKKICLILAVFALVLSGAYFSFAQTTDEQTTLQNQLKQIEAQISQYQIDLKKIASQKNTLPEPAMPVLIIIMPMIAAISPKTSRLVSIILSCMPMPGLKSDEEAISSPQYCLDFSRRL